MKLYGLQRRFFIGTFLALCISVLIGSVLFIPILISSIERSEMDDIQRYTRVLGDQIQNTVNITLQSSRSLSGQPPLQNYLASPSAVTQQGLLTSWNRILQENKRYIGFALYTPNQEVLIRLTRDGIATDLADRMIQQEASFLATVATEQALSAPIWLENATEEIPAFMIATPIRAQTGAVQGYFISAIAMGEVSEISRQDEAVTVVVDTVQGRIVESPNTELIGKPLADAIEGADFQALLLSSRPLSFPKTVAFLSPQGTVSPLAVVYAYPHTLLFGATVDLILFFFVMMGVLMLVLLVGSSMRIAQFLSPLRAMLSYVEEVGQGKFSSSLQIESYDELGDLARGIRTMATRLQAIYAELEARISKRTAELEGKVREVESVNAEIANARDAVLNIAEDLEQQKKSILEQQQRVATMLESIGDGLVVVDTQGVVTIYNQSARQMLGFEPDEIVGKVFTDVVVAYSEQGVKLPTEQQAYQIAKRGNKTFRHIVQYQTKQQTRFFASTTATPILFEQQHIGFILVFRDVTKEREIDRAKSEFISLASHQLRTPLSAINWYIELLLDDGEAKLDENQKEYLHQAYEGSKRMVKLVNALLNVSRIEAGSFGVHPVSLALEPVITSVIDESRPLIVQKELSITVNAQKLPEIAVDPDLMRIVLQNIISNAVKYTPAHGKITVDASLQQEGTVGGRTISVPCIVVAVRDTGMGIPAAAHEHIFTKLYRADNVRKADVEGTGLGLYITKNILEQSGGMIWFESEEQVGTTFYVAFPLQGMSAKEGTKTLMKME